MPDSTTDSARCACPRCQRRLPVHLPALVLILLALSVMTLFGGFALFSSGDIRSGGFASGTVSLSLEDPGSGAIQDSLTDFLPGDYRDRSITVNNGSSDPNNNGSLVLTATANPTNTLTSDATNGLKVQVWNCSQVYTESGSGPFSYTCGGTETEVVATTSLLALSSTPLVSSFTDSAAWFRFRVSMPTTATNSIQGLSTTATWTFTLNQRNGQQL